MACPDMPLHMKSAVPSNPHWAGHTAGDRALDTNCFPHTWGAPRTNVHAVLRGKIKTDLAISLSRSSSNSLLGSRCQCTWSFSGLRKAKKCREGGKKNSTEDHQIYLANFIHFYLLASFEIQKRNTLNLQEKQ